MLARLSLQSSETCLTGITHGRISAECTAVGNSLSDQDNVHTILSLARDAVHNRPTIDITSIITVLAPSRATTAKTAKQFLQ